MAAFDHLLKPRSRNVKLDAGFFRRAGAFLIDILLIDIALTAPFGSLLSRFSSGTIDLFNVTLLRRELGAVIVLFLIAYTYFVLFEYLLGQTPGMMLLNTRVKDLPLLWQALVRNAFLIPVFPLVLFWIIEPLFVMTTKRGALERITNTRTLHERSILV